MEGTFIAVEDLSRYDVIPLNLVPVLTYHSFEDAENVCKDCFQSELIDMTTAELYALLPRLGRGEVNSACDIAF